MIHWFSFTISLLIGIAIGAVLARWFDNWRLRRDLRAIKDALDRGQFRIVASKLAEAQGDKIRTS